MVQEFLKKNTPSLDEYMHREWTDEQFNKVVENVVSLIQPRPVLDKVLERTKDEKMKAAILAKLSGAPAPSAPSADIIDEPVQFESEAKDETSTETPLEPTAKADATKEKDEYDSLFEEM